MRRALEFLVTRVPRSRLGVALVIAVLIFGVIGAARLVSGPVDPTAGLSNRPREPISTVDPEAGDDGLLSSPTSAASPRTRPGEPTPEQTAARFTTAWLSGPGSSGADWLARLKPFSTPALTEKLDGADPERVPARRVNGQVTLRPRTESFVEALIPLDNGQLRLDLVAPDGRWLVDAVDWERQ
ncbi:MULTISPECIES: hypothetical protein [Micromonospora]|uniref:DUF4878 domain-containing protein n=1 Tax=Micromonospora solifontis TaxID=2487138 RepID=A0ABX9WGQ4_9ACTN|nr:MULTISPECIES: hypothetical protein [Micromonospora]NES14710.1 hypothetical protein [Micromonospora sp. PPF5-17B]NES36691.1 hypothetical protein [Micromonospora solifontis]NES55718.1 hypothetical protein [Micromonospora sp. PPF5-6]RNL99153.1 hypothetical protein EFE23_11065 [Micromonospora solifontis]